MNFLHVISGPAVVFLGRLQEGVVGLLVRLRRSARRIHRLHVYSGMLLHQVDAGARPLHLAATRCRHRQPVAVGFAEVFDRGIDGTVLLDQRPLMSSTGSRYLALAWGSQVTVARMSWPDRAWASAAIVSRSLLPCDVM